MSGVWGWFGGGGAAKKKESPKNAILGLRGQLDMLTKREKHLMSQMAEQDNIARKNVNTNKNGKSSCRTASNTTIRYLPWFNSRESCSTEEEGTRAQPRTDNIANRDVGATDQCYRVCQHQPGNTGSDGEGWQSHARYPRQAHARKSRRDHVRLSLAGLGGLYTR